MDRKPRYFTVCVDENDEFSVQHRLLLRDPEGVTRVFASKRLTVNQIKSGKIISSDFRETINKFLLFNLVMTVIREPDTTLPLLLNSQECNIDSLVKSRLTQPVLWSELRPLCICHDEHPIGRSRFAGKTLDIFLSPISVMNFILGLSKYRSYRDFSAYNGLIPHLGNGFYTTIEH